MTISITLPVKNIECETNVQLIQAEVLKHIIMADDDLTVNSQNKVLQSLC